MNRRVICRDKSLPNPSVSRCDAVLGPVSSAPSDRFSYNPLGGLERTLPDPIAAAAFNGK
jgi:hypothetical protein